MLSLQKMLHHRLLIGFLNMSLGNIVQKTCKRHVKDISSYKTFCFFILMYILLCGTNQNNVLQNEIKDLTFEVSNLSITFFVKKIFPMRDQTWHSHRRRWGLEICHIFMDSIIFKQQIYCWGDQKISHFLWTS